MPTTIDLPAELKQKVEEAANLRGMSLDEYVREALEWMLEQPDINDPLYTDKTVYSGEVPQDLSAHHDHYLYDAPL